MIWMAGESAVSLLVVGKLGVQGQLLLVRLFHPGRVFLQLGFLFFQQDILLFDGFLGFEDVLHRLGQVRGLFRHFGGQFALFDAGGPDVQPDHVQDGRKEYEEDQAPEPECLEKARMDLHLQGRLLCRPGVVGIGAADPEGVISRFQVVVADGAIGAHDPVFIQSVNLVGIQDAPRIGKVQDRIMDVEGGVVRIDVQPGRVPQGQAAPMFNPRQFHLPV